jgi:VanZ family protein
VVSAGADTTGTAHPRRSAAPGRRPGGSQDRPGPGGHGAALAALAVAVGTGIELLQWALPLGRVVSPVDAALNAAGAVIAGLLVALSRGRSGGVVRRGLG